MVVTTQLLSFKTVLKLMCPLQESTIPSTCLTAEGELSITATPGLRFRLRVKAVLPLECPATQPEEYCPQVSDLLLLIGILASPFARAPVVALLRTARVSTCWAPRWVFTTWWGQVIIFEFYLQPLALEHNKTGSCHYSLVSSPGSQVLILFLLKGWLFGCFFQVSVNFDFMVDGRSL